MHSMKHFQMLLTRDNIFTKLYAVHVPKRFSACLSSFKDVQYGVTFTLMFVCFAWTTTHKIHHKSNKIVKEHVSIRKHECPEFQRKLRSLVTLSLKSRI